MTGLPIPGPEIKINGLWAEGLEVYRGGKVIVNAPAFAVNPGELVLLSSPSGGGKTSFLLALARLIPYSGVLQLGTVRATEIPPSAWRKEVLYSGQPPQPLGETLRAALSLPFTLAARSGTPQPTTTAMESQLAELGLDYPLERPTSALSLGEVGRLTLARALLAAPSILLLDEPTANLDESSKKYVTRMVSRYIDAGASVVVAAHDSPWLTHDRRYTITGGVLEELG